MILPQQINSKLLSTHFQPHSGVWFRGIESQYIASPLQYSHTVSHSSRFSYADHQSPSFPLLYLAENHLTALKEVQAIFNPPGTQVVVPNPHGTKLILDVTVSLTAVLDLTDEAVLPELQTNLQELTGDWRGFYLRMLPGSSVKGIRSPAPTQMLGAALYRMPKLLGFITVSSQDPTRKNLVIFPDKIKTPRNGKIEFIDKATGIVHQIP
jgi:hypothetical protein